MQKSRKNRFIFLIISFLMINQISLRASSEGFFHNLSSAFDSDTKKIIIQSGLESLNQLFVYIVTFSFVYYVANKFRNQFDSEFIFEPKIVEDTKLVDYIGVPDQIEDIITQIKNPKEFKDVSLARGILLTGKPGVGKTFLARAIAGELQIPFLPLVGSDLVEKYHGDASKKIASLFKTAKDYALAYAKTNKKEKGAAIIFIDEIEELKSRGDHNTNLGLISKLLAEMSGLEKDSTADIIVIATGNNPNVLDEALLRSGRFGDATIEIPYPTKENRQKIFQKLFDSTWKHRFENMEVNSDTLASLTDNMSQADITSLCNNVARKIAIAELNAKRANKILDPQEKKKFFVRELWNSYYVSYKKQLPSEMDLKRLMEEQSINKDMQPSAFIQLTKGMTQPDIYTALKKVKTVKGFEVSFNEQKKTIDKELADKALLFCKEIMSQVSLSKLPPLPTVESVFSCYQIPL